MKQIPNLLVIGGTGRNIGKTTLTTMIIERFSKELKLIALKTSMLMPDEAYFHGHHKLIGADEFELLEEKEIKGNKDSQRYLKAGASQSWFLSAGENAVDSGMDVFWQKIGFAKPVIAESNVLNDFYIPGLFIMVKGNRQIKPQAKVLLQKADVVVSEMDLDGFDSVVKNLDFINGQWFLKDITQ